jgi:CHASE3 domain sensor protein
MNSKRLTVRGRLSIAFGLLAVVVLIVSGMSLKSLNDANDRFYGFVNGINARAEMAESIRTAVDERAVAVRNLVLVSKPADVEIEKAAVVDAEQRVESRLEKLGPSVKSMGEFWLRKFAKYVI